MNEDRGNQIVAPLARKMSWNQYVEVMPLKDGLPLEVLIHQIQKSLAAAEARFENYLEEDEE